MKLTEKKFSILDQAFTIYDANFINEELLVGLQNILPTQKERAQYANILMEADENWTLADKFIKFACGLEAF